MATADEDADEGRVVQTTLGEEEYERLRRVAEADGLSIEEVLRRAAREHTDFHLGLDSLLETVDSLDDSVGEPTDARELDEYLYGAMEEDTSR